MSPAIGTDREARRKTLALLLYFLVFLTLLLEPFDFHPPRSVWPQLHKELGRYEARPTEFPLELAKSLGHAVLLCPLAPLLAWITGQRARQLLTWKMIVLATCLSVSTELLQLTVSRGSSVSDMLMNVLGFAGGAVALWIHERSGPLRRLWAFAVSPSGCLLGLSFVLAGIYLSLIPTPRFPLRLRALEGWDPEYPLCVGNDRGGSRPWLGRIESVVIRRRGMGEEELRLASDVAGGGAEARGDPGPPVPVAWPRKDPSVVAAYRFRGDDLRLDSGGVVREVRPEVGPPLEAIGSGIRAAPPGGVDFLKRSTLRTPERLWAEGVERIRGADAFSIEVRFTPFDLAQRGPARLVSSAWDQWRRNFTLGQDGRDLELRVRTVLTGENGTRPALRVRDCLAEAGKTYTAVATLSDGVVRLYLDGEERGRLTLRLLSWFCWHFFNSPPSPRALLGLAFAGWALCLVPLWAFFERLGWRAPWSFLSAGILALGLVGCVACAAL